MFKIPDWEDDVPKSSANFIKKFKMKAAPSEKSPKNNKISLKVKKGKISTKRSPVLNYKQNSQREKLRNNFTQNKESLTQNKTSTPNDRKTFLITDKKSKIATRKGSLLKHHKNEKNSEMMNKQLQNKLSKANVNIKKSTDRQINIKNSPKGNNSSKLISVKNKKGDEKMKQINKKFNDSVNGISLGNNDLKRSTRKRNIVESDSLDIQNFDSDKLDEIVINAKKKKLNESLENDDDENELFNEVNPKPKVNHKKEVFRKLLVDNSKRNHIEVKGNKLRERMLERLKAAQFRYLNEKLYTSSGTDAQQLFQSDPAAFQTYHQGYQQQVKKWPVNPLDVIVKKIKKLPKTYTIADMGCGEAALSRRVPHKVRSFDLVAAAPGVEACDMAHTLLLSESVDVTVYCLALMGTDLTQYLVEANRVLKIGGLLLIAEVESRFEDVEAFTKEVQRLGFKLKKLDKSNKVFFFMEFVKIRDPPAKKSKLPVLTLKPCLYKRR